MLAHRRQPPLGPAIRNLVGCVCATSLATVAWADYPIGQKELPTVVIHADAAQFKVYPQHPRLFFRDTDLPTLRQRIETDQRAAWQRMTEYLQSTLLKQDPAKYARNPYLKGWSYGRNMTFAAVLTHDARYRDWALRWADALAAVDPAHETNDDDYRGRLMSLAVAYDWLYPQLSDARKAAYCKTLLAHLERNWFYAANPNFVSGHSRWGNFALAAGLLAVVTEQPQTQPRLLRVRENWLAGFFPAQGWIAEQGGYHMAWTYTGPYSDARIHCLWSSASNENVYYPWRAQLPYLFLYGNCGDGTYPNSGDAYDPRGGLREGADTLAVAAGVFKNPHAAWMLKPNWDCFYELLYGDASVKPQPSDDPQQPLPLARHFGHAGVVVMRDRWDERTTHLAFKSSSFYSANHHHRDENGFTIAYRGALAIDSGYYDSYGTTHWWNYFTRTIAHNAITVYDPRQEFSGNGPLANDGGQVFRAEPVSLQDIQPGGAAALDGILRYEHGESFSYALGNATKAYDPQRVKLAEREIVYLRFTNRQPVIVVFDRVESTRPEYEKTFLLHAANRPVVEANRCVIENAGGGRLTCFTLWPAQAQLRLVGGPGHEFSVRGTNYPPKKLSDTWKPIAGSWRLEVSPAEKRTLDYFLHVLAVDDSDAAPLPPQSVTRLAGDQCLGVEVAGWSVVFPLQRKPAATLSYAATGASTRHLIVGGSTGQPIRCTLAQNPSPDCQTGPGGCALLQLPPAATGQIQLRFGP